MASASYRGRMIVNDTDYTGSFVDPNPSGVATENLNTVSIDGKIFNVVGSGGGITTYRGLTNPPIALGNEGDIYYKCNGNIVDNYVLIDSTELPADFKFEGGVLLSVTIPNGATKIKLNCYNYGQSPTEIILDFSDIPTTNDHPYSGGSQGVQVFSTLWAGKDNDYIYFESATGAYVWVASGYFDIPIYSYTDIITSYNKTNLNWIGGSFVTPNPSGVATDDLNTVSIDGKIFNVVGSGGGGSGSSYSETVLWSGNSSTSAWASPVTMSLNDSIRKYDELIIQFSDNAYGYAFVNIPTRDIPSDYAEKYFTNASFVYKNNSADAETGYIFVTADDEILGYTATSTTVTYTKVIGRKFGGNTVNLGAFIDTGRKLYEQTNVSSGTYSYTATEDCVVLAGLSRGGQYTIDGVTVYYFDGSALSQQTVLYLKKGQVLELIASQDYNWFTVYGIQGGNTELIAPIIYSTDEREVGVWKNNKPLYQKTCVFGSVSGQTANLSLGIANIEEAFLCADASYINDGVCPLPYVTGTAYTNNIGGFFDIGVNDTSFAIRIGQSMAGNVSSVVLTVRYTKTTDVAGSGTYNTLGTPMQHYSTTEEVIGTWIDGRTLYRRVYDFTSSPITVPTNTWLKVANDWQIQPIRGTGIVTSSRATFEVAIDCDDNDGLYVRSWLGYGNVNYLIVEYVKD